MVPTNTNTGDEIRWCVQIQIQIQERGEDGAYKYNTNTGDGSRWCLHKQIQIQIQERGIDGACKYNVCISLIFLSISGIELN